jgi:hypothetical protein
MNLGEIISVVDELSEDEREQLKVYLSEPKVKSPAPVRPKTVEEWMAKFKAIAEEFRDDSTDEEMEEIIAAMNYKSKC